VNHELRLPVGNVMNFSEMLNEGLEGYSKEQLKMLSDEVYKNSNRLSSMILNMLDLATLDVKKVDLEKKVVNLSELIEDRVKSCRKIYLQNKPIDFAISIESAMLVAVDPNYIRQVVGNLVINAITFSEKALIKVIVTKKKNMVEFNIIDQGKGIPKAELYDIFTPFKMGTNTESKAEGRGVGLALCKSVIEAHGGIITVDSNDNGAVFKFVLPL
jgi:K+-sensing histidine kinase KdpD